MSESLDNRIGVAAYSVGHFMVKWLCRFILWILGWTPSPGLLEAHQLVADGRKYIGMTPHTSHMDAVLGCLFRLGYDAMFFKNMLIAKWYDCWYIKPFTNYLGFVPAYPAYDGQQGGTVTKIAQFMNQKYLNQGWMIGMSPSGSIHPRRWKSGFFHLAKATGATLCVTGLDYKKKKMVFYLDSYDCLPVDNTHTARLAAFCMDPVWRRITPKFPKQSWPMCHDLNDPLFLNSEWLPM